MRPGFPSGGAGSSGLLACFSSSIGLTFWYPDAVEYLADPRCALSGQRPAPLAACQAHSPVSWRWLLALSATDVSLTTFGVVVGGGFPSFVFLAYFPALAILAVVFSAFWLNLTWTTTVAVVYVAVCLLAGEGSGHSTRATKRC